MSIIARRSSPRSHPRRAASCACSSPPPTASPTTSAGPSSSTRTSARACRGRSITSSSTRTACASTKSPLRSWCRSTSTAIRSAPQTHTANKAGFIIHSAIHMARPDAMCVWHMHTLAGMAVSAQDEGLQPAHMYSHNFWKRALVPRLRGPEHAARRAHALVTSLGTEEPGDDPAQPRPADRGHALIPEAFIRFWRLNRACEIQLAAQSCETAAPVARGLRSLLRRWAKSSSPTRPRLGQLEFDAILRKIDARRRFLQKLEPK